MTSHLRLLVSILIGLVLLSGTAGARKPGGTPLAQVAQGTAVRPPQFEDYPAGGKYTGKHHAPVLTEENRELRTRLRQVAQEKVNFAGHYVFTLWGCGTECLRGAAIDVKTGKVFLLPFTIGIDPVSFHPDSRLIMFQAESSGTGEPGFRYYQIDDKKGWMVVREVPRPPLGQGTSATPTIGIRRPRASSAPRST